MLMVVVPAFRPAPMPAPLYQRLELDTYSLPPVASVMVPPVMLMVTAPFLLSSLVSLLPLPMPAPPPPPREELPPPVAVTVTPSRRVMLVSPVESLPEPMPALPL